MITGCDTALRCWYMKKKKNDSLTFGASKLAARLGSAARLAAAHRWLQEELHLVRQNGNRSFTSATASWIITEEGGAAHPNSDICVKQKATVALRAAIAFVWLVEEAAKWKIY
ncbi:hypothetical protein EYF80_010109 [Liparis tanakae]|uniref:Uncharacterized protein n=1 Tax=Liparis tanakae TaxID=230148 RepID=A0A4Z2IPA6_9TELE|nr:hypothetical protein EYF80_010109 [Liparis tanakae]